ncbi:hypothetical protein VHEMI00290 [[Torrubiella] hemipterigena]|uniref:Transcription factor BYE1 n=1 Tax=[Torrubiella] hemipterigena TaxID=1531966 RepID=A0A0A1T1V8_9HYPO|nr:hypothetical protein VHEMI00290 [[Torrubiella] hemipterigena]
MSGEAEPRRSIRATKGQHTKSFDELEQAPAPKRRQSKKSRKALEQEELEQSEEPEVIRCVCGANEQDQDSGEAWISCETCFAWQHNVCVGVSSFEDEIPENYWCEQCRPQDHTELLAAMAKGEQPWLDRRKTHEEEVANRKKKGGKRGRGKRNSDTKDDARNAKASPTPDASVKPAVKPGKRKSRDESNDADGKLPKLRRVSHAESVGVQVKYSPPPDLVTDLSQLPATRAGPIKALTKSLVHVATALHKEGDLDIPADTTVEKIAETYALQIERAVFDTHPSTKGQKEYAQQVKALTFNLKNNPELFEGLVESYHSPATLAVMTTEAMASSEMQKQTAEMKAKAEKQSILYTGDNGPRVRRTHKGEEVVEDETMANNGEHRMPTSGGGARRGGGTATPTAPAIKRESISIDHASLPAASPTRSDGQRSPSQSNFDISKVFSKVKSPTATERRRPSGPSINVSGPGFDPEVDRLLEDETESPPYSPTEDTQDPDVIWKGSLAMSSIADFHAVGKHVGGANFASFSSWSKLIPQRMTVAGRITEQNAIEYLCSLRYSNLTDIVVVNLTPASPGSQPEFKALIDYFLSKGRYGVVGNKVAGNVRDTYLVPVRAGENGHPEFMLNLVDNFIPTTRTEDMLLAVFVYRNEPTEFSLSNNGQAAPAPLAQAPSVPGSKTTTAVPVAAAAAAAPRPIAPVPGPNGQHARPPQPVSIPHHAQQPLPHAPAMPSKAVHQLPPNHQISSNDIYQRQQAGERLAREILGPFISVPTAQFLLPQAFQMQQKEWETVRGVYERDPKAREDLKYLSMLLEKEPSKAAVPGAPAVPRAA